MGFLEVLTLIFVALKLLHVITWSWWLVIAPEYPSAAILLVALIYFGWAAKKVTRKW